ncbi:MAG: trigger factor, partial [Kiritimatiellia bacterium]|nr:trigger factor [Kiritimatiellia bacterium]
MKIDMESVGPCRRKLQVEVPAEAVDREFDAAAAAYVRGATVPGFRKGKAPRAVVERRFSKEILAEVRDAVVPRAYHEALKEKKLDPVEILDFQEPELARGKGAAFSVTIEVAPEFDLPDYKNYTLQAAVEPVTDVQVTEMFDSLRRQHAKYEDVTDRPAQADDLVEVDFKGTIDGKPIDEIDPSAKGLGQASGFWVSLNDHAFLPGFAAGLTGVAIGEERTIQSAFPETFTAKAIAGKTAVFQVTAKAIRHAVLPEINADYLSKFGVSTEADLRAQIRTELESAR